MIPITGFLPLTAATIVVEETVFLFSAAGGVYKQVNPFFIRLEQELHFVGDTFPFANGLYTITWQDDAVTLSGLSLYGGEDAVTVYF